MYIEQAQEDVRTISLVFEESDIVSMSMEAYDDGYVSMTVHVVTKGDTYREKDRFTITYSWYNKEDVPPFVVDLKAALDKLGIKES